MSRGSKAGQRQHKKKERERKLRKARNQRKNNAPVPIEDLPAEGFLDESLVSPPAEFDFTESAAPLFSPFTMERALRRMGSASSSGETPLVQSEEIQRALQSEPDLEELAPRERAQELAYRCLASRDPEEVRELVQEALELDPECVDALSVSAMLQPRVANRIAALREAVAVGERVLGGRAFFAENQGRFWGLVETRPYMRTREALGDVLREDRRFADAAREYEALLELNPMDNQAVRYSLLGLRLQLGDAAGARAVLERFPEDDWAVFLWGRVLERLLADDRRGAAEALRRARRQNPHVEDVLSGDAPMVSDRFGYEPGKESEAAVVVQHLGLAWTRNKKAWSWLRAGGQATSAKERRAASESYGPPVARLLRLGEPGSYGGDYDGYADFRPQHVPELLRMATDGALLECSRGQLEHWGPLHAMRALGALRAASSLGALLSFLREHSEERDSFEELSPTCERFGTAILEPMTALLRDDTAPERMRMLAAEVLSNLASDRTEARPPCVAALIAELSGYLDNSPRINAFLIGELARLAAVEAIPLIRVVYASERVDESWCGTLETLLARMKEPDPP